MASLAAPGQQAALARALSRWLVIGTAYVAAFLIFYLEPISLGPINVASLWKLAAIGIVLLLAIFVRRFQHVPYIAVFGILFAIASMFNPSLLVDPAGTVAHALKYFYIPMFLIVLYGMHRKKPLDPDGLLRFATHVAVFVALSGIPFVLGLLEPIADGGYDLSLFGIEGLGFNGIFFNSHGASITMGTAAVVLVWNAKRARSPWKALAFAILAAFALYCVVQTFARTGYALAAAGVALVLFYPFRPIKLVMLTPVVVLAAVVGAWFVSSDEVLLMRLLGKNIYTADSNNDDVTSGRFRFWAAAIDSYTASPPEEWALGAGPEIGKERMGARVRMRIGSHNDFIDALLFAGAIGFVLYMAFTILLMRAMWNHRRNPHCGDLLIALGAAYVVQLIVQGERVLLSELMLVLVLMSAMISRPEGRRLAQQPRANE